MSREYHDMTNPFGMDESCTNCPALVSNRDGIVHGYGDVAADFLFILNRPRSSATKKDHPLGAPHSQPSLYSLLEECGFLHAGEHDSMPPVLDNAYVTHRTRCRHPEREATPDEVRNCSPFLTAEIRSINPDILIPCGDEVLRDIVEEYSRRDPQSVAVDDHLGQEIRGRGFEIIPLQQPEDMNDSEYSLSIESIRSTIERDYRQTKGRQGR